MRDLKAGFVAVSRRPARLADKPDREATFSVYETSNPATEDQPFLLIVRTIRIFTDRTCVRHRTHVGRVPDGYSGFPAYSQMLTPLLPARRAAIIYLRTVRCCYYREPDLVRGGRVISARLSWSPMRPDYLISPRSEVSILCERAWRIVSEDSLSGVLSLSAVVHLLSKIHNRDKVGFAEFSFRQQSRRAPEALEVLGLRTDQRKPLEERNDVVLDVGKPVDFPIPAVVAGLANGSAVECFTEQVERSSVVL